MDNSQRSYQAWTWRVPCVQTRKTVLPKANPKGHSVPFLEFQLSSTGLEPLSCLSRGLPGSGSSSLRQPGPRGAETLAEPVGEGLPAGVPPHPLPRPPQAAWGWGAGVTSAYATSSRQAHRNSWRLSENWEYRDPFFPSIFAEFLGKGEICEVYALACAMVRN